MAICKYVGGGITGAVGKTGLGLGSALGLFSVVDIGTRAYTGYGLLEALTVPYIECADGTFSSAVEWYSNGLNCPKRPEPLPATSSISPHKKALGNYAAMIAAMGGYSMSVWGTHTYGNQTDGTFSSNWVEIREGITGKTQDSTDKFGNVLIAGATPGETNDGSNKTWYADLQKRYPDGSADYARNNAYPFNKSTAEALAEPGFGGGVITNYPPPTGSPSVRVYIAWTYLGTQIYLPFRHPKAPPAANIPPRKPGFAPTEPPEKPDCEDMACKCLTPADIKKAVKEALGLKAFAPEKLVREIGSKMYATPGPSLFPVVPKDLVEAVAAMVATVYMRAGYGRYPVVMPDSMIAGDNPLADAVPTLVIENWAEWFEWYIKQQDAVQGEWPIEIAIVDGAKRQPLKFENMAEAIAELTGLVVQTATDADGAVSVASHCAVAIEKNHAATVIAQKNVECLIKFFGVRTGYGSIFVDSVITPMDSDSPNFNLKKFLTASKQSVAFYTDNDPFDFQAVLDRILRNSEIAKAAVAMDASKEIVGDFTRNQRKYDTAEARREAEKELEKLETSLKTQNPDIKLKIRVDTPAAGEIQGNNFVIKRPKTE